MLWGLSHVQAALSQMWSCTGHSWLTPPFSFSLVCRSDEHRSVWTYLNFVPGDTVSQPASHGRTGCNDVSFNELLKWNSTSLADSDARVSAPWAHLCFPTAGMESVGCSASPGSFCCSDSGSLCAEGVLVFVRSWWFTTNPHNDPSLTLAAWIMSQHYFFSLCPVKKKNNLV